MEGFARYLTTCVGCGVMNAEMRIVRILLMFTIVPFLEGKTRVAVAMPPYVEIAEKLGGDKVVVVCALDEGADHETFDPAPSALRLLLQADLYWVSGMGFERSLLPKLQAASASMKLVGTPPPEDDHHHHHHEDGSTCALHGDLHRWLDPRAIAADARVLTDALKAASPSDADYFERRHAAFSAECEALYTAMAAVLSPWKGQTFFVYHGAYEHLAAAFGLKQVALEQGGREPSLRQLSQLIGQAREAGVRVVYAQPQHRTAAARTLADQIGGRLEVLDPLAPNWSENLLNIAQRLAIGFEEAANPR